MSIAQKKFPRDELVTSIIIPDSPPLKKQASKILESPNLQKPEEFAPMNRPYNFQPYLYEQLAKSEKQIMYAQKQLIGQQMELIETKVRDIEAGESQSNALRNIYKNSVSDNQFIDNGIKDVVRRVSDHVASGINEKVKPIRQIPKSKDDIKQLQKVDKYRMLKIKNGEIKNKIGDLRNELEHEYFVKKANFKLPDYENIRQADYYSISNPKTQEANQFIHRLQRQRNQQKQRYMEYLEQKKQQMEHRKELELEKKKAEAEERRIRMEQLYKEKQMKRKMEEEQNMKKRQDYKNWSKIFSKQKPLYLKKEQQFIEKSLIPEIYNRRDRLLEIKLERRPIDVNDINDHDQRYMEYKRDVAIRNEAQIQIQKEKLHEQQEELKQLYKGKYRYLALEQMMQEKMKYNQDPHDYERQKKARQIVYSDDVKDKLFQQIRLKQQQTQNLEKKQFTKRKRNIDGTTSLDQKDQTKMSSFTDPKVDGKKNLQFLKQLVREKGVKKDRPIIKLIQQKHVYPDYLEQIHEKRRRKNSNTKFSLHSEQTIDLTNGTPKLNSLIAKQKSLNQKVKRAELRKKYNSLDYKQDASVQQNQIDAVRLKLKLIQELN